MAFLVSTALNLLAATCLWVALFASLLQALLPLLAAQLNPHKPQAKTQAQTHEKTRQKTHETRRQQWAQKLSPDTALHLARRLAVASSSLCLLAFVGLLLAFARNDFSLRVVAENSHSLLSVPWRLAATWGNHEGSLLLWTMLLTLVGAVYAVFTNKTQAKNAPAESPPKESVKESAKNSEKNSAAIVALHGAICFLFLAFVGFFSNPYAPLTSAPADGAALNPLLQDIGLALHPPVLYLGYVGLSLAWAQAAASLLLHRPAQLWATETLPWLLLAWSALTAGLGLGSLWAYYELGWGGWWFWDPVENLALMPWLVATAALHGVAACRRFALHAKGAQLLCLLAWLLALLATFVVRSGLLTSVHSFALDPQRGLAAFAILSLVAVFSFALYLRSSLPRQNHETKHSVLFFPRFYKGATLLHLLLMPTLAAIVLLGTFYPFALELFTGTRVSVGTGYYALTFVPLALLLPLGAIFVSSPVATVAWRQEVSLSAKAKMFLTQTRGRVILVALVASILTKLARPETPVLGLLAIALAAGLAFESLRGLYATFKAPAETKSHKRRGQLALATGHLALAGFIFAATAATAWQSETRAFIAPGERIAFGGTPARHSFVFDSIAGVRGGNWVGERAQVLWLDRGRQRRQLTPERRYYPASDVVTSETALAVTLLYDFHVQIGSAEAGVARSQARRQVVVLYRPLVLWLWLAFALAAGTGLISGVALLRRQRTERL